MHNPVVAATRPETPAARGHGSRIPLGRVLRPPAT